MLRNKIDMKMKNKLRVMHVLPFAILVIMLIVMAGCQQKEKEKTIVVPEESPEKPIMEFAGWFAEKASNNEIDSLKHVWGDVVLGDSLTLNLDSISLEKTDSPDTYIVRFSPTQAIKVMTGAEGDISIVESWGIFAYPEVRELLARQGGMWDADLNDVDMAERMRDEGYFEFVTERINSSASNVIGIGGVSHTGNGVLEQKIMNKTDKPVLGSDYNVKIRQTFYRPEQTDSVYYKLMDGKDIAPNGTVIYNLTQGSNGDEVVDGICLVLSNAEQVEHYVRLTGNEYQEYLKWKENPNPDESETVTPTDPETL